MVEHRTVRRAEDVESKEMIEMTKSPSLSGATLPHSLVRYIQTMLLKATAAIALLSSAVLAAPAAVTFDDAAVARPQVVLSGARQAALNWGADKLSRIGDDDGQAHAMTQWGWSDCGERAPPLRLEWGLLSRRGQSTKS